MPAFYMFSFIGLLALAAYQPPGDIQPQADLTNLPTSSIMVLEDQASGEIGTVIVGDGDQLQAVVREDGLVEEELITVDETEEDEVIAIIIDTETSVEASEEEVNKIEVPEVIEESIVIVNTEDEEESEVTKEEEVETITVQNNDVVELVEVTQDSPEEQANNQPAAEQASGDLVFKLGAN